MLAWVANPRSGQLSRGTHVADLASRGTAVVVDGPRRPAHFRLRGEVGRCWHRNRNRAHIFLRISVSLLVIGQLVGQRYARGRLRLLGAVTVVCSLNPVGVAARRVLGGFSERVRVDWVG